MERITSPILSTNPSLVHLLLISIFTTLTTATTCYNPDGSVTDYGQPAFQPCNQVAGVASQCCGTNWTGGVVTPDVCQPNGLCLNNYEGKPLYWRSSCTDPTWKSPLCLKNLCTTYREGGDPTQNVALTDCGDGTWCCQGGNTTCCAEGDGTLIAATIGQPITSSTVSTSSTASKTKSNSHSSTSPAAATTTNPGSASATSSPNAESGGGGGLSTGAKAGIAVGVVLVVAIIAALAGLLWRQKRRKPYDTPLPPRVTTEGKHEMGSQQWGGYGAQGTSEVDGRQKPVEMGGADTEIRHEME